MSRVVAGRWRLERRLDAGGANEVWLARDVAAGGAVALKLTRDAVPPPPWPVHPALVRVLASGTDGDRGYLVMPLVPGRTLAALLAEETPQAPEARRIVAAVAAGLEALAAAGLRHGDLRPQNVMVGPDGAVTLIDPGDPRAIRPTGDALALRDLSRRLGLPESEGGRPRTAPRRSPPRSPAAPPE